MTRSPTAEKIRPDERFEADLAAIRDAFAAGLPVRDEDFDIVYPLVYRRPSHWFWTPLKTGRRVAELLSGEGARRVLDIGSGVGKFCITGALTTTRMTFVGIEHRPHLTLVARDAIHMLRADRASVLDGRLEDVDLAPFDSVYLFNPFAENTFSPMDHLDTSVELTEERYKADLEKMEQLFSAARPGTRVITYCGYGGKMPACFDLVHSERSNSGTLCLYIRG